MSRRRAAVLLTGPAPLAALKPAATEAPQRKKRRWKPQTACGGSGTEAGQFRRPRQLFVSTDDLMLYVADKYNHRISIWKRSRARSTDWTHHPTFGSQVVGIDQLNSPFDAFVSSSGLDAWIADSSIGGKFQSVAGNRHC